MMLSSCLWCTQSDEKERINLITQNNELRKRIVELEKNAANAKTAQDDTKINAEIAEIDKDSLYTQKLEGGYKLALDGKYEEAIKIYNEAMQIKSDGAEVYFYRSAAYYELGDKQQGDKQQAIKDYNKAIELKPDYVSAYNSRSLTYLEMKQYKNAIEYLTKYLESEPNDAGAYCLRGGCYQALGDKPNAEADYAKAKKLANNN